MQPSRQPALTAGMYGIHCSCSCSRGAPVPACRASRGWAHKLGTYQARPRNMQRRQRTCTALLHRTRQLAGSERVDATPAPAWKSPWRALPEKTQPGRECGQLRAHMMLLVQQPLMGTFKPCMLGHAPCCCYVEGACGGCHLPASTQRLAMCRKRCMRVFNSCTVHAGDHRNLFMHRWCVASRMQKSKCARRAHAGGARHKMHLQRHLAAPDHA